MNKYQLIDKVLSGTATEEEIRELNAWMDEDPRNREEYDDLVFLWEFSKEGESKRKEDPHFYDGLYKIKKVIESRSHSYGLDWKFILSITALLAVVAVILYCCLSYGVFSKSGSAFIDRPLSEVISMTEDKFNVVIEVENKEILTCRFSGSFSASTPAEEIVHKIASTYGFRYKVISKHRYRIIGSGCR